MIDERTDATPVTTISPDVYADPDALGQGLLVYGCMGGRHPLVASATNGAATTVHVPDAWSVDGTVVRATGRRWLSVHLSANHYDASSSSTGVRVASAPPRLGRR